LALPAAAADAAHGKAVFAAQCASCHSPARNGATILGPTLFGVVGRPSASVKGFVYSSGMKAAGFSWSNDRLRAYLPAPKDLVPGTHMSYAGLKNPGQLDDLIAYLDTLK
jgi:cytochrome c